MTANELADMLEVTSSTFNGEAAAMLRKQHEAIEVLREAHEKIAGFDLADESAIVEMARAALAATEEFQK